MPKAPSPSSAANPVDQETSVPFEKALDELETLVLHMEDGTLSLDQSLAAYRRGADLVKVCESALERAREQVRVLDGELLRPLSEMPTRGAERG
jgi:exodeoxyribonuclease VII small subunit